MKLQIKDLTWLELEDILAAYNRGDQTEEQELSLVAYIHDELYENLKFEPTLEQIANRLTDTLNSYSLRQLVKKGLLDVFTDTEGEESFGLTDLGKSVNANFVEEIGNV